MQELDLYRFLKETDNSEMRWEGSELLVWLTHYNVRGFTDMIGGNILSEGGIECRLLQGGFIGFDLVPICEYHGIDPERILPKSD